MYCRKTFEELLEPDSAVKPFSFCYEANKCDLSQVSCVVEAESAEKFKLIYEVIPGVLRVTLDVIKWSDFPVIEYTPFFENISDRKTGIISDVCVLDYETEDLAVFGVQKIKTDEFCGNSRLTVRYALGAQANGSDFLPQKRDIFSRNGCNELTLECSGARSSNDFLPFFGIDNDHENGVNVAVGWSGGWKFSIEKEITSLLLGTGKMSRMRCGMKQTSFCLYPGEKVMQPGMLLHFREGRSIRDGQNEFRRFMLAHHSPRNSRGELLKPPLSLETWGGLETHEQLRRIDWVRENNLPYESFWIDAGWMGTPGPCPHFLEESEAQSDWFTRVGSWDFNTWAHPEGLRPIADALHQAGMRFLVWFEVLRIHSTSQAPVLKEHPEWLLGDHAAAARGEAVNFLLNIGIPEARQYLLDTVCSIIDREKIDDYREDFNMDILEHLTSGEPEDRRGINEMKFIEGFYAYWAELRRRYPDMFIDNCASGGRRLDYKTASFAFPLCQSDFACYMPYEVECVQLENIYLDEWLPLHGTLNWGMEDPYHAACGMGCGYACKIWQYKGREPQPDHDFAGHRKFLEWVIALRDIHLTGDVYLPVNEPECDMSKWSGQQIHDPEYDRGMVQIFRRRQSKEADFQLHLEALQADAVYQVEFFSGEKKTMTGRELALMDIHLESPRSFQTIRYEKVRA